MAFAFTINGVSVEPLDGSVQIEYSLNARHSARFRIYYENGYKPTEGSEVVVTDNTARIFGGQLDEVNRSSAAPHYSHPGLYHDLACVSFERLIDKRLTFDGITGAVPVYKSYSGKCSTGEQSPPVGGTSLVTWVSNPVDFVETSQFFEPAMVGRRFTIASVDYTVDSVIDPTQLIISPSAGDQTDVAYTANIYAGEAVTDLFTNWIQLEGILLETIDSPQVSSIQNGAVVKELIADYSNTTEVLDKLAELSDFIWWVSPWKVLYFQARDATTAPFDITSSSKITSVAVVQTKEDLANTDARRVNWKALTMLDQTFLGDGLSRAWHLTYPVGIIENVTVNDVDMTFGVLGVDEDSGWYYNVGSRTISVNVNDPTPTSADVIKVYYRKLGGDVIPYEDAALIAARIVVEPGTSGKYQHYTDDSDNMNALAALDSSIAYVQSFGTTPEKFTYRTCVSLEPLASGLMVGQVQNVDLPKFGLSGPFLITQISVTNNGPSVNDERTLWYEVTAATGAYISDGFLETFERFVKTGTGKQATGPSGSGINFSSTMQISFPSWDTTTN